ncbi:MAG TPA: daunorubicin ABC transporter ATP-binding protein [Chloroflexi bacterium]|nr:daunorubicin ABC transporter ATP-binding protein [Chloroflexota bacterium]
MNEKVKSGLAIEAQGLIKRYDEEVLAVDGIDLAIEANTIYSLLGPNGAGKTTTLSILTTLLEPSAGSAAVCGLDVVKQANEVRKHIGVTFQETVLDDALTGRQALDFHGQLYQQSKAMRQAKIEELLVLVELEDAADRKIRTYSGGMKRRLELIRGLMTEPDVLFLDEPTLGLDPQSRVRLGDYITDLKQNQGLTLMLTTHYMDEAQLLSDRVGIIDHGKIVAEGTPSELIEQMGADVIQVEGQGNSDQFVAVVKELPFTQEVSAVNGVIQIGVASGSRRLVEVVSVASDSGFRIEDISVAEPSLGDVFLKYTGRQFRD